LEAIICGPEISPPVQALVHGLKYGSLRRAVPELVSLAADSVPAEFSLPGSVLVPVPLHGSRLRERGYNQSRLAAQSWSKVLGAPVAEHWLERVRSTGTQTKLGSGDRRRNLAHAFAVGKSFRPGVPVVLVDDVLTTGSTLSACAAALLAAGAPSVRGLCLAWAGDA
jgi:ComF family protein